MNNYLSHQRIVRKKTMTNYVHGNPSPGLDSVQNVAELDLWLYN
jgi:hypothetical protein